MDNLEKKGLAEMMSEQMPPASRVYMHQSDFGILSLTEDNGCATTNNAVVVPPAKDSDDDGSECTAVKRGRKKGSTDKAKIDKKKLEKEVKTKIAIRYKEMRDSLPDGKILHKGCLDNIIKEEIVAANLSPKSIKRKGIITRYRHKNFNGFVPHKMAPLLELEPLIVE
jgi:hypothetical protein